jgi:hypothetical protein
MGIALVFPIREVMLGGIGVDLVFTPGSEGLEQDFILQGNLVMKATITKEITSPALFEEDGFSEIIQMVGSTKVG